MKIRPIVRKKKNGMKEGKGFSKGELEKVGIDFKQALRAKIPIDLRRQTKHEENIKLLKHYLRSLRSSKPRKKRKSQAG